MAAKSFIDYSNYFRCSNQQLRDDFLNIGKSLNQYSTEVSYKKHQRDLVIFFEARTELRNKPIIENGNVVGHYRLAEPYHVSISRGSFLVKNYTNLKVFRESDFSLRSFKIKEKSLLRRKPRLILNHKNFRLEVNFESLIPLSVG